MTKDVLVSVAGIQFEIDEKDVIEVITSGSYYYKNGKHYVLYEEHDEQGGITKNRIKVGENCVEMKKSGAITANMIFENGKTNTSYYDTGFGTLLVQVKTTSIACSEEQDFLHIKIFYSMDVNYAHVSKCCVEIKVQSKNSM